MSTVEIEGRTFRIGRINAMDQLAVAARLAPVLASLGKIGPEAFAGGAIADFVPVLEAIARMSDEDRNEVLGKCLGKVEVQVAANVWSPVWNMAARQPQDDAMALPLLLRLVFEAAMANLGGFSLAVPGSVPAPGAA